MENENISEEENEENASFLRKLNAIGQRVAKIKDEAVSARAASGFETQWQEDEEFCEGIDEYNTDNSQYIKPRVDTGGLISRNAIKESGSTAFINITRPFVDAGSARMGDILLPANEWNFHIKPTPVPEFEEHEEDDTPTTIVGVDGQPLSIGAAIKERNKEVVSKVNKAKRRIEDWLVECGFRAESRKVIECAAMVGTGVMKGPYPVKHTSKQFVNGVLEITQQIQPASKCISYWNVFPDMNCGGNIQDGEYFIERDFMTAGQLYNLIGTPGYQEEQIMKVLKEGPNKSNADTQKKTADNERFECWYCYVTLKKSELAILDDDCECVEDDGETPVSAVIVMVNDTVIKGYINPMESGEYPYDFFVWQRIPDKPFGIGIARQGRAAQKMVLAATRALLDNMGLSAIPMMAVMRSAIRPMDGSWKIAKGKMWEIKESSGIRSIDDAIQVKVIPSLQDELTKIIELGLKFMEDSTGITFMLQGQQGSAPDTVGGMTLLHQNSSSILRRCARIYDENITIPHISRYHEYLLLDPAVPDDEKGDLNIEATGSSALVEREIQYMQLPQLLQLAMNPVFEKSPKKVFDEVVRAFKFDPGKFDLDQDEKQALAEQQQPIAPQVQAAQIRAETDLQKEQMRQEANVQKVQVDMDRDRVFAEGVTERNRMAYEKNIADTQLRIQEMELKLQLAQLDYANKHNIALEKVKADLARDAMKINLQKELAYNDDAKAAEQVITPPSEPAGRARDGYAFQE